MNKKAIVFTLVTTLLLLAVPACDKGDYFGPMERTFRSSFNGWDMWNTDAMRPFEADMPLPVPGTVQVNGRMSFSQANEKFEALSRGAKAAQGQLSYRRYCHHCHGPAGAGRIIVAESFDINPPDLRRDRIQNQHDEQLFVDIRDGVVAPIPLGDTMTPLEIIAAIHHVRLLKDSPAKPYYPPQSIEPIK